MRQRLASLEPWLGPALIAVAAAGALFVSWGRWPDIQVDFGRELYVPWRIVSGDLLYTDIAYFNGPFSPYWNALAFRLLGVGLWSLVAVNLVITGGVVCLLYWLLRRVSDAFSATVALLVFVSVFAFSRLAPVGNYNFATPYAHEVTHALALSLLGLYCFARRGDAASGLRFGWLAAAGSCAGLVLLTKPEHFLTLAAALAVGLVLDVWSAGWRRERAIGMAASLLGGGAAAVIFVLVILSLVAAPSVAFTGLTEPWSAVTNRELTSLEYYRWVRGTLDLGASLTLLGEWLLRYLLVIVLLTLLAWIWGRVGLRRWWPVLLLPAALALWIWPIDGKTAVQSIRPLPVVVPLLIAGSLVHLAELRRDGCATHAGVLRVTLLVFALGLQAKMLLNAQLLHYGFALMMPSTLLLVVALVGWLPRLVERRGGSGVVWRLGACAFVLAMAMGVMQRSSERYARLDQLVSAKAADTFLGGTRVAYANAALERLRERMGPDETLAVLPEGVMFNYLLRRRAPPPHINYMPPELRLYGEADMLESLRADPPDYVAFVHKRTSLYGYPFFGHDYGQALYGWVLDHYEPVLRVGRPPFEPDTDFGIQLLRARQTSSP